MAGEKYIELAHRALFDYFVANFATYIAAVETAQSLPTGSLARPIDYIPRAAIEDNRAPILMVFDTDFDLLRSDSQRPGRWSVGVDVVMQWEGDADLSAHVRTTQRYATAMLDTVRSDITLGGKVLQTLFSGYDASPATDNDPATKHLLGMSFDIQIES